MSEKPEKFSRKLQEQVSQSLRTIPEQAVIK